MKKIIVSIVGGGIRGIIPACVLVSFEKHVGKLTRDTVAFCGGTSTGALLTATVAAGVPASDSLDIYLKQGEKIFSPTNSVARNINLITRGRQFDSEVLYEVVHNVVSPKGNMAINEYSLPLLITACDLFGDTVYFTQDRHTNSGKYGEYSLTDAAVASACATTFHDPWPVGDLGALADGGTGGVANPVYQIAVEALNGLGCYGVIDPADAILISLGTGYYRSATMPKPPETLFDRIGWVTSALVGSSETIATDSVRGRWPGLLTVIDAALPSDINEADVDAIPDLLKIGQNLAAGIDWEAILQ